MRSPTDWSGSTDLGGCAERAHPPRIGDGGAQRDRRHPAARRNGRAVPRAGRPLPHRRRPGRRQDRARRRGDADRPDVDLRPQDVRAQGRRRALCPAPAAGAPPAADRWRRAGARAALGHPADPALRRPRRAAALAAAEMEGEAARLRGLRDRLQANLMRRVGGLTINGDSEHRLAGNLNLSFPGPHRARADRGLPERRDVDRVGLHLGDGRAVLPIAALGLPTPRATAPDPLGLGRFTTAAEVDFAVDALAAAATRLSADRRVTEGAARPT